jgi:glyoxylase-like metal-dependent hydrolase (beta-lactamase superfamily II)
MERIILHGATQRVLNQEADNDIHIKTLVKGCNGVVFASSSFLLTDVSIPLRVVYDTSFPYHTKQLLHALEKEGLCPGDIDYILLSHWHFDHCGSIGCFPGAGVILSYETLRTMGYFDRTIKYATKQKNPTESLANILLEKMSFHKKQAEKTTINDDNYKFYNNYPKAKAIANILLNNKNIYSDILDKGQQEKLVVIKEPRDMLSAFKIYTVKVHTEGDLILGFKNHHTNTFFVGDILESMKSNDYKELLKNGSMSQSDGILLKEIFDAGNEIFTAHGKHYQIDGQGQMLPVDN